MANYYTTRYHPGGWPPPDDTVPAGVEWSRAELAERGLLCCTKAALGVTTAAPREDRWVYHVRYRLTCPDHGETVQEVERQLDWISPNEYLLDT